MTKRFAFTLLELVFAIVILGILSKFGVEFLAQSYKNFIFTKINNELQSNSEMAVELIAARLQYRIKDSVIARTSKTSDPVAIGSASGTNYKVLEWVGYDNEGIRGNCETNTTPNWSGIIDLNSSGASTADSLYSPETNTTKVDTLIDILSNHEANLSDAALYFIGSNSDVQTGYGWDGNLTAINAQQGAMHPITFGGDDTNFSSSTGTNFSGVDVYEYYQLAWSAYAIVYEPGTNDKGTLKFYWNYQPWKGENISNDANETVIVENVSSFQFTAVDALLKIQICVKSDLVEDYAVCKEKTIF